MSQVIAGELTSTTYACTYCSYEVTELFPKVKDITSREFKKWCPQCKMLLPFRATQTETHQKSDT